MFGDTYPRFIEVSELPDSHPEARNPQRGRDAREQRNRMNERYDGLIASNADILKGARVLDLASHDGRYSFAALKAGAAHVTGVEVRESLIERAKSTFEFYDQDPSTYDFVQGDMFDVLANQEFDVDVVLCFGFMYHTYRHTELMHGLHRIGAKHLILDTMVMPGDKPTMKLHREPSSEDIRSAAQDQWAVDRVVVGWPSVSAIQLLLKSYDFELESMYDWPGILASKPRIPGLEGYASGKRVTMRIRYGAAAREAGLPPVGNVEIPAPRPKAKPTPAAPAPPPAAGWKERVNKTLAKTLGYELRRTTRD